LDSDFLPQPWLFRHKSSLVSQSASGAPQFPAPGAEKGDSGWNASAAIIAKPREAKPHSACLGLIVVLSSAVYAQTLPPGAQKVTSIEGITEYAFPNGLRALLFPENSKPKFM
jgi:hypothetical protein